MMLDKDIKKILNELGFKEKGKNKSFYLTFKKEKINYTLRLVNHKKHKKSRYKIINLVYKTRDDILKYWKEGKLNYENY